MDPLNTLVGKGKVKFFTRWPDMGPLPTSLALVLFLLGLVCSMGRVLHTGLVPFLLGYCIRKHLPQACFSQMLLIVETDQVSLLGIAS